MRLHPLASLAFLLTWTTVAGSESSPQATTASTQYLPDSTVILRVGDRVTRAIDMVNSYYASWPEYRPPSDSAGRVQFLNQLINKEVMGAVAQKSGRTLGFEDRLTMRQHTERVLSTVLYQRMLLDSIRVTDADVQALRRHYSLEKNLQHILFSDAATAARVRKDLLEKRIRWEDAQRRYSKAKNDPAPGGGLGWIARNKLDKVAASRIFDLEQGQISEPHHDPEGIHLVRVVGQRPIEPPDFAKFDRLLQDEVRVTKQGQRGVKIHHDLSLEAGLTFDEANIAWAAPFFPAKANVPGEVQLGVGRLPDFAPSDTGRVLARWRDGALTLATFVAKYKETHPFLRTALNTPSLLRGMVEVIALEPFRARLATRMGLDRDPMAVKMLRHRQEELLVEHLYHDSIQTHVRVTDKERRKYYQDHIAQFITYPSARFAVFNRGTKEEADALAARLRGGEKAVDVLVSDSIRFGRSAGFITTYNTQNEGQAFYKLVMEELKPGEVGIESTDRGIWVVQSLSFDPGRQLSYEEAQVHVGESLANLAAEKLLNRFLARHKRAFRIEAHPELVMRVDFSDPMDRAR